MTCARLKKIYFLRVTMILDPPVRNSRSIRHYGNIISLFSIKAHSMSCEAVSVLELRVENCIETVAGVRYL